MQRIDPHQQNKKAYGTLHFAKSCMP